MIQVASRGQALYPDLPDTPRGEKGLVSEMSRGVPIRGRGSSVVVT